MQPEPASKKSPVPTTGYTSQAGIASIPQYSFPFKIGRSVLCLFAILFIFRPCIAAAPASAQTTFAAQTASAAPVSAEQKVTSYTLPPDLYRKAHHLGQIEFWGQIVTFFYSVAILLIFLNMRLAPKFRDWAERAANNRFLQAVIFAPLLVLTLDLFGVPADLADHWIARRFGLSVQSWPSWFWDWIKSALLVIFIAIFLVWLLYVAIRKSPRRCWFYFWIATIPICFFLVFLQPVFVDPMFHRFEPLAQKNAPLAAALEQMVQRTGENIPVDRMYWMDASEKTNELNAYVTGIGASKRIVLWDTTIAQLDTPQTVSVVGHEMGHYVLNHIAKGIIAGEVLLLALFYLGYRSLGWLLARCGPRWEIREPGDRASLPVLLLLLTIFSFVASPLQNAFSRHIEHQADQYGLEVTHGLTPDSAQVAAQSFEILGKIDLEDPAPNPVDVFMFYSHPTIQDRIHFALTYDPWSHGGHGEFVP
jgi:Zn-dependent protease with chaperone function